MNTHKHWAVCLDLTRMDDLLVGYVNFLAGVLKPSKITFLHIVEPDKLTSEIMRQFPGLESIEDLVDAAEEHFEELADRIFTHRDVDYSIKVRRGTTAAQVLNLMKSGRVDLLVMGKKNSYKGEGVAARKLVKYVPSSVLLVPESARYRLDHITVPVDFSEQSANAVRLAVKLTNQKKSAVTAQHIYQHPKEFFTASTDKKDKQVVDERVHQLSQEFISTFKIDATVEMELTVQREPKMSDEIYDLSVHQRSDLILVAYKARKNFLATLKDNLPDRMSAYNFGIPLFILKNPDKTQKLFDALVDQVG